MSRFRLAEDIAGILGKEFAGLTEKRIAREDEGRGRGGGGGGVGRCGGWRVSSSSCVYPGIVILREGERIVSQGINHPFAS